MKKTLTVNISGIVFHIDEDAYNVLNDYLQSIKQHFSKTEGGDEIVSDIEARIAEMLKESIGDKKQVITIDDIERVIEVIGQPSEFGADEEDEAAFQNSSQKRNEAKRLYRDTDKAIIGGICAGLGAYFHSDPLWFRLAFVLVSIAGLGTPLLIYFILWIVVPEAKTATERLEMKGEKVNISNIEKSVREEIDNLKNKFNDFTKEAKRSYKKKSVEHRPDIQNLGNALSRILEVFVKIVLVFAGIILLIVGISLMLAFLAAIVGFGHQVFIVDSELVYISYSALVDLILGNAGSNMFFETGLMLLFGIPLFMILYGGIKLIFGIDRTRYVGVTALNLWLIGLFITVYYGFKISNSFSEKGVHQETVNVDVPENSPLLLDVKKDNNFDRIYRYEDYFEIEDMNMIITSEERNFFYGIPRLEIEKSKNDNIELEVYYRSRGRSRRDASERAGKTVYKYSVTGNSIEFDRFFKLRQNTVWREQNVDLVLKVPVGCYLQFSDDMYKIINDRHHSPRSLSGETWLMTDSGLEETEYIPVIIEEQEGTNKSLRVIPEEEKGSKPVSMISFIYYNFLKIFSPINS
ncbi:MAG: hypothetical protein B6D61_07500 [Bacteroidetes bacterium 4484_249]|nr:MAG: hypothetical protein B6D61_07500 [Bacteroidetes bacterium 4484_249]